MTEANHIENREEVVNFLKADLLGPSTIFDNKLDFQTLDTNSPIRFANKDDNTLGPFIDSETGQEILARYQPLQNYSVGILFTKTMQKAIDKEDDKEKSEEFELPAIEEYEENAVEGIKEGSAKKSLSKINEDLDKNFVNKKEFTSGGDDEEDLYDEIEDEVALANQRKPESIAMSVNVDPSISGSLNINISGASYEAIPTYMSNQLSKQRIKNLHKPRSVINLDLKDAKKYWLNTDFKALKERGSVFAPNDGLGHHEILNEFKEGDQIIFYKNQLIKGVGIVISEPKTTDRNPLDDGLEDASKMGNWKNSEDLTFTIVDVELFELPIYIGIDKIDLEDRIAENKRTEKSSFNKNGVPATKYATIISNEFFEKIRNKNSSYWPLYSPLGIMNKTDESSVYSFDSEKNSIDEEALWDTISKLESSFSSENLQNALGKDSIEKNLLEQWLDGMVNVKELLFDSEKKEYSLPLVDKLFKNYYIRRPLNHTLEIDTKRIKAISKNGYLSEIIDNEFLIEHEDVNLRVLIYIRKIKKKDDSENFIITTVLRNISIGKSDENAFFQAKIELESSDKNKTSILPYPEHQEFYDNNSEISEEEVNLDLLYHEYKTYGVGHGVSVDWEDKEGSIKVFTEFIPTVTVSDMTPNITNKNTKKPFEILMDDLTEGDGFEIIEELLEQYDDWVRDLKNKLPNTSVSYIKVAEKNISEIENTHKRIKKGLKLIKTNDKAQKAFQLANEAMSLQQKIPTIKREIIEVGQRKSDLVFDSEIPVNDTKPKWRAFQIAFILLNIDSIINDDSEEREIVDLLWFPTGGGKTEAYLGLLAFTIFYRRLIDPYDTGTVSLMRYTYRLLTAQQFERSSRLICSMEFIRNKKENENILGEKEISIAAFVGYSTSPNNKGEAVRHLKKLENKTWVDSRFIIEQCPWCAAQIGKVNEKFIKTPGANQVHGIEEVKHGESVQLYCPDINCHFKDRLPIFVIDEDIYDNTPTFVIGTVDKFARLMYRPQARSIFGIDENGEQVSNPPSLIIQDELHLINGALGSTVAFFESIIDFLCSKVYEDSFIKPKVICSTATIKNAEKQIKGIFNRKGHGIFPPVGLSIDDSFFSVKDELSVGKKYVGVTITQFSTQQAQANVLSNLNQSPAFFESNLEKDPWWTNVCYFHSMRELGNTYSILQEDVIRRLMFLRMKFNIGKENLSDAPNINNVKELTSRLESPKVVSAMNKLAIGTDTGKLNNVVRNALATSVIEVGIDIQRLSLLTILGQPKNTSQYIQVSGRVGRKGKTEGVETARPGLVVTIFNPMRPRDRSHFEKFKSYHSKLHTSVEPTSVTPFSINSYERSLYGALFMYLSMKLPLSKRRAENPEFPNEEFNEFKSILINRDKEIIQSESFDERLVDYLDRIRNSWEQIEPVIWEDELEQGDIKRRQLFVQYGSFSSTEQPRAFKVANSMRDVDETSRAQILFESKDLGG